VEIRSVGAELLDVERRKDGQPDMTMLNFAFHNFVNATGQQPAVRVVIPSAIQGGLDRTQSPSPATLFSAEEECAKLLHKPGKYPSGRAV